MKDALNTLLGNIAENKPVTTIGTQIEFSKESLIMALSMIVIAVILIILTIRLTK